MPPEKDHESRNLRVSLALEQRVQRGQVPRYRRNLFALGLELPRCAAADLAAVECDGQYQAYVWFDAPIDLSAGSIGTLIGHRV
jgi:hypothetical protein